MRSTSLASLIREAKVQLQILEVVALWHCTPIGHHPNKKAYIIAESIAFHELLIAIFGITLLLACRDFAPNSALDVWGVALAQGTEFKLIDLTPDASFLRDFYNAEERHWGAYANLGSPDDNPCNSLT
eukprot:4069671-Amphidinium_carterae.1